MQRKEKTARKIDTYFVTVQNHRNFARPNLFSHLLNNSCFLFNFEIIPSFVGILFKSFVL